MQENFDNECNSPSSNAKFSGDLHYSNESFSSNEVHEQEFTANEISTEECDKFREVLENRCSTSADNSPKKQQPLRKKCTNNIETEVAQLNKEMEEIQLECQGILESHMKEQVKVQQQQREALKTEPQRSPRVVPRMGTRLEYLKYIQAHDISVDWKCKDTLQSSPVPTQNSPPGTVNGKDTSNVSANVSAESCRSAPLTLELNQVSDDADKSFKNSMLCLAPVGSSNGYVSDTEKQTQTPTKSSDYIIDVSVKSATTELQNAKPTIVGQENQAPAPNHIKPEQVKMGESLQDLYMQYSDIMYTNHANLQHTIAVQQKLFQQQMDQKSHLKRKKRCGSKSKIPESPSNAGSNQMGSDSNPMEWVVKRRPDGTRYVTRRPIRNRILKERAKKISEERCGMTTDDDAMSELKLGRYWTKEERKSHMEKSRDQKRRREQQLKAKMETLKEADERKELNIVELSHKKMLKHKGKKVFDDFMTVQEMFSHGSRVQEGKTYNPLLSVTTV